MKIIVAGGRDFNDYSLMRERLNYLLMTVKNPVIVSGGAKGADSLAVRYATEYDLRVEIYPAQWDMYGKSAGYKCNVQMSEVADGCVAFWNGRSKGTKHMIETMQKLGKPVKVVRY